MFPNVIFDLDGTLLDTLQDLAAAGNHTLSALGFPTHPADAYRRMVGNGISKLVERMLPAGFDKKATFELAFSIFTQRYAAHMRDLTTPYPGIPALLEGLSGKGIKMAVASNKADALVREIVGDYFPGVFSAVIGLRDDMPPKPDPACVFWLMRQLSAGTGNTLYVGDSDVDILTASACGLPSCGVLWGFRGKGELSAAGATYLAANTDELSGIILS